MVWLFVSSSSSVSSFDGGWSWCVGCVVRVFLRLLGSSKTIRVFSGVIVVRSFVSASCAFVSCIRVVVY